MRLLRALDAGLTAFVNELWPVPPAVFSDEWFESSPAPDSSSGVAGVGPALCESSRTPRAGHPNPDTEVAELAQDIYAYGYACSLHAHPEAFAESDSREPLLRTARELINAGYRKTN